MYILFILFVSAAISVVIGDQTANNIALIKAYKAQLSQNNVSSLYVNLNQYFLQTNTYPATVNSLVAMNEFSHLKSSLPNSIAYSLSGDINDSKWNFKRSTVVSLNTLAGETQSSILSVNKCGSGDAGTAVSWCGSSDKLWVKLESRESYNSMLSQQRVRQQRLMHKIALYFNDAQYFPDKKNDGSALAVGQLYMLHALVGYLGSSSTCTGNFQWRGIPLDCSELFDLWGNSVGYQYISSAHVAIVSTSQVMNNSGSNITIATDLDVN